jgi:catechol 2,3-dioxygenase-like lactoylglutathione lyase family enzyme
MKLWNVGGKVADLNLEETFLRAMGADVVGRQPVFVDGEEGELLFTQVGDTRVLVFEEVNYERALDHPLKNGWTHIVFEVDDFDATFERLSAAGGRVIQGPSVVDATFSKRKIAFFESPGGCIYEVFTELPRD